MVVVVVVVVVALFQPAVELKQVDSYFGADTFGLPSALDASRPSVVCQDVAPENAYPAPAAPAGPRPQESAPPPDGWQK